MLLCYLSYMLMRIPPVAFRVLQSDMQAKAAEKVASTEVKAKLEFVKTKARISDKLKYEGVALTFGAYFKEPVIEEGEKLFKVRKLKLSFDLSSGKITISEPGASAFLKATKVSKEGGGCKSAVQPCQAQHAHAQSLALSDVQLT